MPGLIVNPNVTSGQAIPPSGGNSTITCRARAQTGTSTSFKVTYSVAPGFPYRVTNPGPVNQTAHRQTRTFGQSINLSRSGGGSALFVRIDLDFTWSGGSSQRHTLVQVNTGSSQFAAAARSTRNALGLTQAEVASRMGMHRSTVSRLENDHGVSEATRDAAAAALSSSA